MVTIYIVDDELVLHNLYKQVFAIKGYQVVADAYDGEEAVKKFIELEPKPDVIIMDHRMPNKDGIQAMREILAIDPNARIVFISADSKMREVSMKNGAKSFGLKPITMRDILDLITTVMAS